MEAFRKISKFWRKFEEKSEIVWKKPQKNVLEDTWSKTKSFFIKEERPIGTRYESKICIILIHFTEGNNDF